MQLVVLLCALSGALSSNGEVAYIDIAAGEGGAVCITNAGGETRQIGPGKHDGPPQWSYDGEWLAFESQTAEGRGLYVVRADGSDGRTVGKGAWCTAPAWSTDSTCLAYGSAPASGTPGQVRVLDLNSGEDTPWGKGVAGIAQAVWMPFSELVLFLDPGKPVEMPGVNIPLFQTEARMTTEEVMTATLPMALLAIRLRPDLSGDRPVARTDIVLISRSEMVPVLDIADEKKTALGSTIGAVSPNWTKRSFEVPEASTTPGQPFGDVPLKNLGKATRIAFESNMGGDREIMVLTGKRGIANVSNHRAADWNPVWSPDGDNLAFESFRGGSRGIYNVFTDTAHVTPLAVDPTANCWSPTWSSDGASIAFVTDREGQAEICCVGQQQEKWTVLTRSGGPKAAPAWRPVRK